MNKARKDTDSWDRGSWKLINSATGKKSSFPNPPAIEEEQVLTGGRLKAGHLFRLGYTISVCDQ